MTAFALRSRPSGLQCALALAVAGLFGAAPGAAFGGASNAADGGGEKKTPPAPKVDWDQAENIKGAARRIGEVQRRQGADAALKLIADCYKTHSLSATYSQGFEGCIAQDYIQTRILVQVYGRLPKEVTEKLGTPSADELADRMGRRFAQAFGKYEIPVSYAKAFKALVDKHGWPVFLKIVFPGNADRAPDGKSPQSKQPSPKLPDGD